MGAKHLRRPADVTLPPTPELCLFHRCDAHENVRQLNATEEDTGSECGACIAEEMLALKAQLMLVMDGYAERLAYCADLRQKLDSARARLNLLSPGAGDELIEGDGNDAADR